MLGVSFTIDSNYDWGRHSNFRSDMYTGDRGIYFTVELLESVKDIREKRFF